MSETRSIVIEYALQNEKNLEIAFETNKAYHEICNQITKKFLSKLKERLEKTLVSDNWIFPEIESTTKLTFLIKNKKWTTETAFGLIDFNDADRACFGVSTDNKNRLPLLNKIQEEIQGKITGFGWWKHLDSHYNKWDESFDGLNSIYKPDQLLDYSEKYIIKLSIVIDNYFNLLKE